MKHPQLSSRGAVASARRAGPAFLLFSMGFLLWPPALFPAQKVLTGDRIPVAGAELMVHPVHHASVVLGWKGLVIYVDPVGGAGRYSSLPQPDLILITHAHSDHLDIDTLKALAHENTAVVAPSGVLKRLPDPLRTWARSLDNGQAKRVVGVGIEAIPAYNLAGERQKYHPKGRGNGYVLTLDSTRVYLSGDTEDIAEMRALTNIHVAFVCMNLPYTMSVEQAASAVRAFRPRIVYPYHYRGSDLDTFKRLVGTEGGIEVRLRDWYKEP